MMRRYWIPEMLHVAISLAIALGAFALSNTIMHESGLLTVTVMGVWLANQNKVSIRHLVEFKENLRVLLLSVLFVLLSARLDLSLLKQLGLGGLAFAVALIFVARPLSIYFCTLGTALTKSERLFLCWMAPRGIVAAAVTSVFALSLQETAHKEDAMLMMPAAFLVIGLTVLVYGLTAAPLARKLGLAIDNPQGTVIIGAHGPARELAHVLHKEGFDVLLVDSNWRNITVARQEGLKAHFGDALSERLLDDLPLDRMGRVLALTGNYTVNALATLHFAEVFGRTETYQMAMENTGKKNDETELPRHLRGRILFGDDVPFRLMAERIWAGAKIKVTPLTETFTFKEYKKQNPDAIPMLVITEDKRINVVTSESPASPQPGQRVICLA
jgi:hypothetical protein